MNTNPDAIKILCYGDSNTWGYIPSTEERYPVNIRWTGRLQELLGDDFWVVEEGLNGRTTNVEDPDSPGKNGLEYLLPCLKTHNPIDLIILMLGTNDTKEKFSRKAAMIASGIEDLLEEIRQTAYDRNHHVPRILLLSPPYVDDKVTKAQEDFTSATKTSQELGDYYQRIAEKKDLPFIDIAELVKVSREDGIHLEPEGHKTIAKSLYQIITSL